MAPAETGRTYTVQGKFREAPDGFKRVVDLRPKVAQALAGYADAFAMLDNRSLEGEPEKVIMQAVHLDPANVNALPLAILRRQVSDLESLSAPMAVGANGPRIAIGGNAR
jgi:cytochrome c-type biogenesis protein CcmH/NrfG